MKFKAREEGNIRLCGSVRLAVVVVHGSFYLQFAQVTTTTTTSIVIIVVSTSNYSYFSGCTGKIM